MFAGRSRVALAVLALAMGTPARAADAPPAGAPGAVDPDSTYEFVHPDSLPLYRTYDRRYIREDTLAVPFTYIYRDPVETSADRVSLREILERCIEAEKHQFDDVEDITFRMTERVVLFFDDPADSLAKRTIHEEVSRIYRKQPNLGRTVSLGTREYTLERKGDALVRVDEKNEVGIDVRATHEELTDLPFFFEELSDFDFGIEERVDLDDRVLYRISFTPRSEFDPLPTGEFWIDTTDFRIFHTDLRFTDNVPAPLFLKGVEHASIEMQRIDGVWVYDRISARVTLRKLPFVPIPRVVDIVVVFDEYRIDDGLSLEVFGKEAG